MIGILSYGLGNVKAFANIYKNLNIPHSIVTDEAGLRNADKIILPGVGAFDHAMQRLRESGLMEPLREVVLEEARPVLGICVGMQMLAERSEEGEEPGLGWIGGIVRKIRFPNSAKTRLLPHMGWNTISAESGEPLLTGMDEKFGFYFLHSYQFDCQDDAHSIARADYGGTFTCAVRRGMIHGVQFHPEKSHHNGIRLLKNFAEI